MRHKRKNAAQQAGIDRLIQRQAMAHVDAKNVPMPDAAVTASGLGHRASGIALTLGGASRVFGIKPVLGAAAEAGFLVGVSPSMHDLWRVQDREKRQSEMIHFTKNTALLGGSLAPMGVGDAKARSCLEGAPLRGFS